VYELGAEERQGMQLFLRYARELPMLGEAPARRAPAGLTPQAGFD
jgi:hypothetical protein